MLLPLDFSIEQTYILENKESKTFLIWSKTNFILTVNIQ